ncbi:CHASE3 domain-containing protein [Hymenobacter metallicola]|uniref:Uncharacterized protein n=1 Tax=Hymenobacter metallicola TaxID=2563114 RepID=A0A4Z0QFN3_9BACT|nr:hypothetical protein [Hymenobacter metallicola]TGE28013.1 hypothetical protein E5K02_00680 [Hymenobacter metallicola]
MIDYLFALLFLCFPSALITAYIAHMNNRSLWRWLLFGFCVPFVAIFVAMIVTYYDQKRAAADKSDSEPDRR